MRLTLAEKLGNAKRQGIIEGKTLAQQNFDCSKAAAQRDILKAAAELAQANAKLTYAMSRMIAEKGW